MIRCPLIALALVLAASAAHAQASYPVLGASTRARAPLQADPTGPRSDPTATVGQAVARLQIEKAGYSSVRGLWRTGDGAWHGMARNPSNAAVPVTLAPDGKVAEMR